MFNAKLPSELTSNWSSKLPYIGKLSIQRLPVEILCEIFFNSIADQPLNFAEEVWNSLDPMQAPWTLTRVCKSWRTVALANQRIWCHIRLHLRPYGSARPSKRGPSPLALILFLERSGSHPLYIHFGNSTTQLFHLLMSQSHRWREVSLYMPLPRLQLTSQIHGRVPILRHLTIIHCLTATGLTNALSTTSSPIRTFEVAPELREVYLDIGDPRGMVLPWPQLTQVGGRFLHDLQFLKSAANVVDLTVDAGSHPSTIRHERVRRLRVYGAANLEWLDTPALEELYIHAIPHPSSNNIRRTIAFIQQSSFALTALTLRDIWIDNEVNARALLESCPGLVQFHVSICGVAWNTLARLLTVTEHSCLLPKLQHLEILGRFLAHLDASIPGMLESRLRDRGKGMPKLKSISLVDVSVSPEDMNRLLELEKLGLCMSKTLRPRTS